VVALNATSIAVGASTQGTVTLTAAASTGGATVSLSSSNPTVATVQTPVAIQAGASSGTFTVTALASGATAITATLDGASVRSTTLNVTANVAISAISLSAQSVIGGGSIVGGVTLTGAAPPGGALVALSAGDPLTVPASVTVPGGSATASFTVATRVVGATTSATLNGSYGGASASAVLSVTGPPVATASFGVSGPTETETCALSNSGNTLNCTFNGSTSTAAATIVAWDWSYGVATTLTQTTSGPVLTMPAVTCGLIPPPPMPSDIQWFTMTVTLRIHDALGNVSADAVHKDVRLFPASTCGF